MLLYIHGFNSSPESHKASLLKNWLATHHPEVDYQAPYLKPFPAQAISQLENLVEKYLGNGESIGLIGSSLGGFYAEWLAEKYQLKTVLVNPAIRPFDVLDEYIGENKNYYNDDCYELTQAHVDELKTFYVEGRNTPAENLLLMVQTGDESLDFKEATAKHSASPNIIAYGGDHGFQNFNHWFEFILTFLNLTSHQKRDLSI